MKGWRLLFVQILFLIVAIVTGGRLLYWQVLLHSSLEAKASSQHEVTTLLVGERGKIFASDGSLLVGNQPAYLLYANLTFFRETFSSGAKVKSAARKIAKALLPEIIKSQKNPARLSGLDKERLLFNERDDLVRQLSSKNLVWVPLAKKISESTKSKVAKLNIAGLGFEEESKRYYPEGNLASQVLGFVGKDQSDNDVGYFGLEGFYDGQLRGREGRLLQELDASGNPILTNNEDGSLPENGFDITTTIDRNAQYVLDREIKQATKKYGAKVGSAVIMDPKTGAILAMTNYPDFSPASWQAFGSLDYKNSVVSDVYEPGSTFKAVTMSSGLDSGSIKPTTICPCAGPIRISGYQVETWNNQYNPHSTILEILQHSDNVGAGFVAQKLGVDRFLGYIKNFGFGAPLSIDLQGEEGGLVKERQNWSDIDLVTAGFGQGISVTSLQMASAYGVIANDGKLMKPYLVKKISSQNKDVNIEPKLVRQVIKPKTAKIIKQLLLGAVLGGEARHLIPRGYRVAGKTGTAQVAISGHYDPSQAVASFVGFGPVEDPKFVMIVKFVNPFPIYGAETAEPTFFNIVEKLYPYWGISVH